MAAQIQGFHLLQFVHGEPDGRAVLSNLLEALPAVGGVDIVPLLLHGRQDALDPLDVAADVVLAQRPPIEPALLALGDEIVVPIHVHLIEGGGVHQDVLNLPQGDGVVLQGALGEPGACDGAVVLRRMVDEALKGLPDGQGLPHGGPLHAPLEVLDDLQVEVPIPTLALRLGIEVGLTHEGLEFLELDVDLIAPHRLDLVAHPLLGLVPMVRAQDSVSRGEFELVSPALCDADVDGRLTVG